MKKIKKRNRKSIFTIIKLVIGIGLFAALLFWENTPEKLGQIFASVKLQYFVFLILVGVIMNLISSAKWGLFISERGVKIPLMRLFNLYLIGKFFNNFMPSMVGGDITRAYLLGKQIDSQSRSAASVFMERFTGLIAMLFLAIIFSLFNFQILSEPIIGISIVVILISCVLFFVLLFNPILVDRIANKLTFIPFSIKMFSILRKLMNDIRFFKDRYKLLSYSMIFSVLFHICTSVNVYLSCLAIGLYPSFLDIAVITPIILLVVTIPVSPNNIGWWEWTFSVLLVNAGAGMAQGLAVALILRGATIIFSLVGGILFLFEKENYSHTNTVKVKNN